MADRRNRRNFYRVLHVQPDAPGAILKSSYRALMMSLEMHPDRGGDHWNAALINEAYGVLSDPAKRAEYDRQLDIARVRTGGPVDVAAESSSVDPAPDSTSVRNGADETVCLFCSCEGSTANPLPGGRVCLDCRSPLTPAGAPQLEAAGRRGARRVAKSGRIRYYVGWPQPAPEQARLVDLSPAGLQFEANTPIDVHHIIKLEGPLVDAVGRVAICRERSGLFAIGVEFYTVRFAPVRGTFLSTSA